jgi:hypothetical protein
MFMSMTLIFSERLILRDLVSTLLFELNCLSSFQAQHNEGSEGETSTLHQFKYFSALHL